MKERFSVVVDFRACLEMAGTCWTVGRQGLHSREAPTLPVARVLMIASEDKERVCVPPRDTVNSKAPAELGFELAAAGETIRFDW